MCKADCIFCILCCFGLGIAFQAVIYAFGRLLTTANDSYSAQYITSLFAAHLVANMYHSFIDLAKNLKIPNFNAFTRHVVLPGQLLMHLCQSQTE